MDLVEIRCLIAVIDEGSMLAASTRLGVPRGTLRRRIDELEARAGVPLLVRSARGVVATEAGEMLARHGRGLLVECATLLSAVREVGGETSGALRVRIPVGLPAEMLVLFFKVLHGPSAPLPIAFEVRDDPLDGDLGDVDLIVHFSDDADADALRIITLAHVPLRIVASAAYLQRAGLPTTLEDLARHDLFAWSAPERSPDRWPLRSGGVIEVEPLVSSNDPIMVRSMARADLGLALALDGPNARLGLPSDDLVRVLPDLVGAEVPMNLSIPRALGANPKLARVVDVVQQRLLAAGIKPR